MKNTTTRRRAKTFFRTTRKSLVKWHSSRPGFWIERAFMFLVLLALINILYPVRPAVRTVPKERDIAREDIIAPYTFFVQKSEEVLARERQSAADGVPTVVNFDQERTNESISAFRSFLSEVSRIAKEGRPMPEAIEEIRSMNPGLTAEAISSLINNRDSRFNEGMVAVLKDVLERGLLGSKERLVLGGGAKIALVKHGKETIKGVETLLDSVAALNLIKEQASQFVGTNARKLDTFVEAVSSFTAPNLIMDVVTTQARKKAARDEVSPSKGVVMKGEMIVRAHDVVTEEIADKLRSLEASKGEMSTPSGMGVSAAGRNLLYCMILGVLAAYLAFFKVDIFRNYSLLVLISLILAIALGLSAAVVRFEGVSTYLIPISVASILACMLLDAEVGIVMTVGLSVLVAVFTGLRIPAMAVGLFGGLAAVQSVRVITRRSEFYRAVLFISLANILCILGIELLRLTPMIQIMRASGFGVLNAFASTFIAIGLLPLCEHAFGVSTNIRLLELSDLNRPLLRELAIEAPGTFHHSIVVANLAQTAAEAVDANPLLARVAAYYHDIGKLTKPGYFIENQTGKKNPHDELAPKISSLVLASHIKDGLELARKEGLPKAIVDVLREHHGTALMFQFYEKCLALHPDEGISDIHFRYPGPKPKSKEAAIVMLADSIEAKVRSLESPTPSRLKGVVKEIVDERLKEGQLDESDLTLRDLHKISERFLPVLIGVFHPRLGYPTVERVKNGNTRGRSPGKLRTEAGGRGTTG
jgi:putative nucleotidyltransferase with HDIG domain